MNNRRQFFDKHAEKWDSLFPEGFVARVERHIVPLFGIGRSERVLDVGSGTGIILPFLKKAVGRGGEVVALDFSGSMLKRAEEKYGEAFTYVRSNAEKTPFEDGCFDAVVCFSVFPHFVNKLKVLRELCRVLRPGGRLTVAHADSRETINGHHRKVGTVVANDRLPDEPGMTRLMRRAGLDCISIDSREDRYIATGIRQ